MRDRSSPGLLALFRPDPANARLDELCGFAPAGGPTEELVFWFVRLTAWLRPDRKSADARVRFFRTQLAVHPELRANVTRALGALLARTDVEHLLAYGGIPREFHFLGAVKEWLVSRSLPEACATTDGAQIVRLAFRAGDRAWVRSSGLVRALRELVPAEVLPALTRALDDAMLDLVHQVIAQAHAPSVRKLAQTQRPPFRGLYDAVAALVAEPGAVERVNAVRGRVRQCLSALDAHRAELVDRGADLNTTFQLARMCQQLERLALLATLRHQPDDAILAKTAAELVHATTRDAQGKGLLARSSDLVVQNLVDTAATVGRKYLGTEQSSFWAAFRAGAGGGALMALATAVKVLLSRLHLPSLYEGIAFSMNYAAAFCAAYLLHFTIATKLPAHTATALARAVQGTGSHRARLAHFVDVWRAAVRLQLAGLFGNVVVAGPLAFAADLALYATSHHHLLSTEKAARVLTAQSALGPSIVFAGLTGLFLWISSLVAAAGDNATRVSRLADRLATNVHVMKRIGPTHARASAEAIVPHIGGLAGNVALGFLLGAVPAAFAIASLPVEIRHVTVSTSSVALALATGTGSPRAVGLAVAGVVLIGAVNVAVSFVLALQFALRSAAGLRGSMTAYVLVRLGVRSWLGIGPRARRRRRATERVPAAATPTERVTSG